MSIGGLTYTQQPTSALGLPSRTEIQLRLHPGECNPTTMLDIFRSYKLNNLARKGKPIVFKNI